MCGTPSVGMDCSVHRVREFADNPKAGRFLAWARRALDSRTLRRTRKDGLEYAFALLLAAPLCGARERPGFIGSFSRSHGFDGDYEGCRCGHSYTVLFMALPHICSSRRHLDPCGPVGRAVLAGVVLGDHELLVLSQYTLQFERDGATGRFTDAINPLSLALPRATRSDNLRLDWGIENVLDLFPPRPAASASRELALHVGHRQRLEQA